MATATTQTGTQASNAQSILRLFPDVDTSGEALEGHDEEQIRLMDEVCIVIDENDVPVGKGSKKICRFPQTRSLGTTLTFDFFPVQATL
jgi:isopentenyl-diphosphate delta-isomerase